MFGTDYAGAYDALYADKDYAAECDLIETILQRQSPRPVDGILDLGCGTGRHARVLAGRGHRVLGVDRSPFMIERARAASWPCGGELEYVVADLRTFRSNRRFDAVLMMFAVLGYQLEDADVLAALRTARVHLSDGGLLLFDCWYGPAVLRQQPSDRSKTVDAGSRLIRRVSRSRLDLEHRRIGIDFHLEQTDRGATAVATESHAVRFFFREEIDHLLAAADLSCVRIGGMPNYEREPDESTWNILVCARAAPRP